LIELPPFPRPFESRRTPSPSPREFAFGTGALYLVQSETEATPLREALFYITRRLVFPSFSFLLCCHGPRPFHFSHKPSLLLNTLRFLVAFRVKNISKFFLQLPFFFFFDAKETCLYLSHLRFFPRAFFPPPPL